MRLIDADKLMKAMYHRAFETDGDTMWQSGCWVRYRAIEQVVKEQPTVKTEPRWIPCSERLPQSYVDVLVWFEYYRYVSYTRLYQTHGIGTYSENYESWTINHESGWHKLRVIAWMPLPEPYMEEDE